MKVKNLVPEIYYKESRDFSYVGRLFEIVFNYLKTNVDLVGETFINNEINASIVELVSTTLGFESKHQYQTKDLSALCSVFALLLRTKGAKKSIEDAITLLLHTQSIDEDFDIDIDDEDDQYKCIIYVPKNMTDIVLLEDVFDYILPAGWTYAFRRKSGEGGNYEESYGVLSNVTPYKMHSYQLGQVGGRIGENEYNTDESVYGNGANRSMTYTSTVVGVETPNQQN